MSSRLKLQELLKTITEHVYFQPPSDPNPQLQYPCIMYKRDGSNSNRVFRYADNIPYKHTKRYQVTVIDRNPDTELPDIVEALPYCALDRAFAAENLNHYVFTLFF